MLSSLPSLLALSILLGLVHVIIAAALSNASRGVGWNLGNRDGAPPAVSVHAGRAQRAAANFLETFVFFAAAVVCAIVIDRQGEVATTGAQVYFWARVAYLPIYLIGIPVVRSLVWGVALVGLLMVVFALF